MKGKNKNIKEDVWKRINIKGEDDCWEWKGYVLSNGYGQIRIDYRRYRTHRLVYELTYGPIPEGLLVCHKCNNRKCCNPKHLYVGTQKDNLKQMIEDGRKPIGENSSKAKLNWKQINEIRKKYIPYIYTQKRLGKEYSISESECFLIINNKVWKNKEV